MTSKAKSQSGKDKVEAELDEALAETFPASDPPAMTEPPTRDDAPKKRPARRRTGK